MALLYFPVLLLVLASNVAHMEKEVLCVWNSKDSKTLNESVSCYNEDDALQCSMLNFTDLRVEFTSEKYDRELEIHLCSAGYNSTDLHAIKFYNMPSISINGHRSILNCNNEESGLYFESISKISVNDINFNQCGFNMSLSMFNVKFNTAVSIINSTNINISSVSIWGTSGTGLFMLNTGGYINITESRFEENHAPNHMTLYVGGGVFIGTTSNQSSVSYKIHNCSFANNTATREGDLEQDSFGGGINAYFKHVVSNLSIAITKCVFVNNTARYGGALSVSVGRNITFNVTVAVSRTNFDQNTAHKRGGAMQIGFIQSGSIFQFSSCNFTDNVAESGGGVYLYATPITYQEYNNVTFLNSYWTRNAARYGSAIYAAPYFSREFIQYEYDQFSIIVFHNC